MARNREGQQAARISHSEGARHNSACVACKRRGLGHRPPVLDVHVRGPRCRRLRIRLLWLRLWRIARGGEYLRFKSALLLVDGFKLKPERDIVLYGKSIGLPNIVPCKQVPRARRHDRLRSRLRLGALFLSTAWAMDAFFHNIGRLASNKSPVQIVHGTHDEVVAFSTDRTCMPRLKHHPLPPAWIDGARNNETVHSVAYMRLSRSPAPTATPPNDLPPVALVVRLDTRTLVVTPQEVGRTSFLVKNETSGAGGWGGGIEGASGAN